MQIPRLPPLVSHMVQWTGVRPSRLPFEVVFRWPYIFYRQLRADKAFVRGAGMAYASLVALVPLFVLLFAVFRATGLSIDNQDAFSKVLFGTFFAEIPQVETFLLPGLENLNLSALSMTGIVALLIVSGRLYLMVELAYNDIFGVPISRGLPYRLLHFYFVLTAIPIVLALTIGGTVEYSWLSWAQGWMSTTLRFAILLAALKLFPCTEVRWGPALLGSSVSWGALEVCGRAFEWYLVVFASDDPLRIVYGTLGVIPVFLLWLYVTWIVILLGVEIAHVTQNYDTLLEAELEQEQKERQGIRALTVEAGLLVAARIALHFSRGSGPMRAEALSESSGLGTRDIYQICGVLERCGYVMRTETGWLLSRPAADIALADLSRDWRSQTVVRGHDDRLQNEISTLFARQLSGSLEDGARRWIATSLNTDG